MLVAYLFEAPTKWDLLLWNDSNTLNTTQQYNYNIVDGLEKISSYQKCNCIIILCIKIRWASRIKLKIDNDVRKIKYLGLTFDEKLTG